MDINHVQIHADGTRKLFQSRAWITDLLTERREAHKAHKDEHHEHTMRRIRIKKAAQNRNGWPAEKSPI